MLIPFESDFTYTTVLKSKIVLPEANHYHPYMPVMVKFGRMSWRGVVILNGESNTVSLHDI